MQKVLKNQTNSIHFHKTCFNQTGIPGKKHAKQELILKLATENLQSGKNTTVFEQKPVKTKKKLIL